jgi:uncharacterized protein (TIRG00374 family)
MRRSWTKLVLLLLLLLIVGFFVYRSRGVIQLRGFSWDRLMASARHASLPLLLLALLGTYGSYALRALRWVRFSRYLPRTSFLSVYRSTMIGFTAIFLLGRAGEPIRPLLIARKDRVPISNLFGIYVLERLFDAGSTAVLAGLTLIIFPMMIKERQIPGTLKTAAQSAGIALIAGLLATIAFLVYFRLHGAAALERKIERWHSGIGWRRKVGGLLLGLSEGLQAIRTWSDLVAAVGYSAAHWMLVAFVYVWVAHSFGGALAEIRFTDALLVLFFCMVGSMLQLPAVGGGSQAASFIAFTQVFRVEIEPAMAASVVLWLVTFAASSLIGVPLLIHEGWSMGELKHLAQAEREAEAAGAHLTDPANAPQEPATPRTPGVTE